MKRELYRAMPIVFALYMCGKGRKEGMVIGRKEGREGDRNAGNAPMEQRGHEPGRDKEERGHERVKYMCYLYFFAPFVSLSGIFIKSKTYTDARCKSEGENNFFRRVRLRKGGGKT